MHLEHTLEEEVALGFIVDVVPFGQVDGLRDATCKIYECVGCVASIEGLVTARQPEGRKQGRRKGGGLKSHKAHSRSKERPNSVAINWVLPAL